MTGPSPSDPPPGVQNGIDNSTVSGQAVQAGAIYGGVHYYNVNASAPQPVAPAYQPVRPAPIPVRRRAGVGAIVGRCLLALLPAILGAAVIGGAIDQVAAGTNIAVRLLAVVALLALGMTAICVYAAKSGRGIRQVLGLLLDKATSRHLASLYTSTLVIVFCFAASMWLFGFTKELVEPDPVKSGGATGALVFLAFLATLVGRLIARRRQNQAHTAQ